MCCLSNLTKFIISVQAEFKSFEENLLISGALATVTALGLGLYNLRKQNQVKQQFYMRARVGAQGFTIASLIGGLFYQSHKKESENKERLKARMQQKQSQDSPKEKPKS